MIRAAVGAFHGTVERVIPRLFREFIKFGVVGTIGFAVDFTTYGILTRLLGVDTVYCLSLTGAVETTDLFSIRSCAVPRYPIVAANMASVFLAVSSNFFLNKFWTFRDPRHAVLATQGAAYLLMSAFAWTVNQVLTGVFASRLDVLHAQFGANVDLAAKILAIAVVMFINFGGSKFVIFRRARERQPDHT